MNYWDNVYYAPEKHGLVMVAEIELLEPNYSFDMLAAWIDKYGQWYLGTDSGCSCAAPFENYNGIEDLTGPLTIEQTICESTDLWTGGGGYDPLDFVEFLHRLVTWESDE